MPGRVINSARGSSPLQPQVVWLKEARTQPTEGFPAAAESLSRDLGTVVRLIHQKLPSVKAIYLTSRIYAGYASTALNPEPYAYEAGFAVKWLIESQIAGVDSLNFDPDSGAVEAPWLSWGPYLWSDGLEGRSDGFTWSCSQLLCSTKACDLMTSRVALPGWTTSVTATGLFAYPPGSVAFAARTNLEISPYGPIWVGGTLTGSSRSGLLFPISEGPR